MDEISYGNDNKEDLLKLMNDMINVLGKSGFFFKAFMVSGEMQQRDGQGELTKENLLKGNEGETKCLGLS